MFIEEHDPLLVTDLELSGAELENQVASVPLHTTQLYLYIIAAVWHRARIGISNWQTADLCFFAIALVLMLINRPE
jgi:hypothetical protein